MALSKESLKRIERTCKAVSLMTETERNAFFKACAVILLLDNKSDLGINGAVISSADNKEAVAG